MSDEHAVPPDFLASGRFESTIRRLGVDLIGKSIGVYHITEMLARGGMGEVYRATDTKLQRDVAIKVLPDLFVRDAERLARFIREAQTLASLNHPNIAIIHGLEQTGDAHALVMELVAGEDLSQRIARGAIPVDEALPIAKQIADALEAAHEQGIIHRDLKPANVKVRADGTVKVLDFGLAKAMEPVARAPAHLREGYGGQAMTQAGIILGTAAYMSPEQALGKPVDKRTDIWAFGCVLYEMLTGVRAFAGDEVSDTLAFVLTKEPAWSALPASTPASIRRLLRRCLAKDPRQRLSDIADVRLEIAEVGAEQGATPKPFSWSSMAFALTGVLALALWIAISPWAPWQSPPDLVSPRRLSAELGMDGVISTDGAHLALSPDGLVLAFQGVKNGSRQLYVRPLDQLQAIALPGTIGAANPFFSPDGQWIGFFAEGKLKKVAVTGGAAVPICDAPDPRGGAWGEDGDIVFNLASSDSSPRNALLRVSSDGGTPQPATTLTDDEVTHRWPQVLPGARAILYTAHNRGNNYADANIVVQTLPNGPRKILQRGGSFGRYVPSGHLVYVHDGTLFAAPFDHVALEVTGPGRPVIENIFNNPVTGGAQFAFAANGTAVYLPGRTSSPGRPIEWLTRDGKIASLRATRANWSHPQFSPDGTRLAMEIFDNGQADIAVYDLARDRLIHLTSGAQPDSTPVWTPDGQRISFVSGRVADGRMNLYWVRADGGGDLQQLSDSASLGAIVTGSWHPSGRFLAFSEGSLGVADLMILPMEGDEVSGWKPGKPYAFLNTPAAELSPSFSPDGRWLAYHSNESGRIEVHVRPFPKREGSWLVSDGGGQAPTWSRAKNELLYLTLDNQIMAASYTAIGNSFRVEAPKLWTERRILRGPTFRRMMDLHPDGERVAAAVATEGQTEDRQDKVVFIFNFFDDLRRIASATKH